MDWLPIWFGDYRDVYDENGDENDKVDVDDENSVTVNLQLDEETLRQILTKVFPSGGRSKISENILLCTLTIVLRFYFREAFL